MWLRVLRQKDEPERVAGGMALGVMLGFMLPPGVQMLVAVALAPMLRVNLIAAALGTWVTNPITIPFIYPGALIFGEFLTGLSLREHSIPLEDEHFWAFITDFRAHSRTIMLLEVGLMALGAMAALPMYYITKLAVVKFRKRSRRKHVEHMAHK